mmetsp:Transcript_49371/g.120477  ORF Transcript_49371/g.120477 Transcript_49371/m.120477 type:complete len:223 (-) Transcript_49371:412-1080(-)
MAATITHLSNLSLQPLSPTTFCSLSVRRVGPHNEDILCLETIRSPPRSATTATLTHSALTPDSLPVRRVRPHNADILCLDRHPLPAVELQPHPPRRRFIPVHDRCEPAVELGALLEPVKAHLRANLDPRVHVLRRQARSALPREELDHSHHRRLPHKRRKELLLPHQLKHVFVQLRVGPAYERLPHLVQPLPPPVARRPHLHRRGAQVAQARLVLAEHVLAP